MVSNLLSLSLFCQGREVQVKCVLDLLSGSRRSFALYSLPSVLDHFSTRTRTTTTYYVVPGCQWEREAASEALPVA